MNPALPLRAALSAAVIFCLAACDGDSPPTAQATPQATPPVAAQARPPDAPQATFPAASSSTPPAAPDKPEVVFGDGFHKEEVNPGVTLRWVREDAALRVTAPAAGRYRLTFRPFTAFSTVENIIAVNVNGLAAGSFFTHRFDPSNPELMPVEATLRAGDNDLHLHSKGAEIRLGENDDRMAAYGLVLPLVVERVP